MQNKLILFKKNKVVYLFILPAFLIYLVFGLIPFFMTFQLSFFKWDGISTHMQFVGFSHYKHIFFSNIIWWRSVLNAAFITLFALIFQNSLALFLAILVNLDLRGKNFYRLTFYLPPILSVIVVGILWQWIYDGNFGILNFILTKINAPLTRVAFPLRLDEIIMTFFDKTKEQFPPAWLQEPKSALLCVAFVHSWQGFGNAFILFLAGLHLIPQELYEAAEVDGAGRWEEFKAITMPLLNPVLIIVSILTVLGTMQIFPLVMAMTQGGPGFHTEVPIIRIYKQAFSSHHFGYATAMAVVLGLILLILSVIQIEISRRRKIE